MTNPLSPLAGRPLRRRPTQLGFRLWRWAHELGWRTGRPLAWSSPVPGDLGDLGLDQPIGSTSPAEAGTADRRSATSATSSPRPFARWMLNTLLVAGARIHHTALAAFAATPSRGCASGSPAGLLSVLLIRCSPGPGLRGDLRADGRHRDVFPAIGDGTDWAAAGVPGGPWGEHLLMKGSSTPSRRPDESPRWTGLPRPDLLQDRAPWWSHPGRGFSCRYLLSTTTSSPGRCWHRQREQLHPVVGLYNFVSDRFNARWGIFAAGASCVDPIVIMFQFLQRYIVSGSPRRGQG